jgi:hypothetical protein
MVKHRSILVTLLTAAGAVTPTAAVAQPGPGEGLLEGTKIVNSADGTAMSTYGNSSGDINAVSIRTTDWPNHDTQWVVSGPPYAVQIRTDRPDTRCLEPLDKTTQLNQKVVLRSCDGSDAQRWTLRGEAGGGYLISPQKNQNLVVAPEAVAGSWSFLALTHAVRIPPRLWHFSTL